MIRYGRKNCKHVWRYRKDGYEEYCSPVICKECGAFGCSCDVKPCNNTELFSEEFNSNANINGKWKNPYMKKEK